MRKLTDWLHADALVFELVLIEAKEGPRLAAEAAASFLAVFANIGDALQAPLQVFCVVGVYELGDRSPNEFFGRYPKGTRGSRACVADNPLRREND